MNKQIAKVVEGKYLVPFILITSLFFLWGIANDMTNPLVLAFKKVMPELSNTQTAFVQLAFYGGYGTMAIPAALFIRKFSYKAGILIGLALYATGALLFFPAARYELFAFFLASLYILTFGLAFLETTANPFILSLGHPDTATRRLNLSQTFNPLGSLSGMLIAQLFIITLIQSKEYSPEAYALLPEVEKATIRTNDLSIISAPYIGLGLFIIVMFILIAIAKIPQKEHHESIPVKKAFKMLLGNKRYYEGVIAQMFYVGVQIMCWTFIFQYVDNLNANRGADSQLTAMWFNMSATVFFFSGRALSTMLMKYFQPARLMYHYAIIGMFFILGTIFIGGIPGLCCLVATSITMSLMFPTIYGIALKDMGDEAKLGSAGLVMAIVGGALLPPIQGRILDIGGGGFSDKLFFGYIPEVNLSFVLPLICLAVVAVYSFRSMKIHLKN